MRQGYYKENKLGKASYKSFCPANLQDIVKSVNIDKDLNSLLIATHKNLARIDSMVDLIKNVDIFLYSYVYREALESSRIEGTECTMEDLFENSVNGAKANDSKFSENNIKKIEDIKETISNINAIYTSINLLKKIPISTRLLKEVHKVLLKSTRGKNKNPGEIRTSQNWIGGDNIEKATFVPPNVDDMNESLSYLEKFANDDAKLDELINVALIHYQFETIHPFLDGNGRIGRILILLYLIDRKILAKPILYVSYFLKINQMEYYSKLMEVRTKGRYEEYIKFFIHCIYDSTVSVIDKIEKLDKLHNDSISKLGTSIRKKDTLRLLLDYIEITPIFDIGTAADKLNMSYNTVAANVNKLIEYKLVKKRGKGNRNKTFEYHKYLDIIEKV